MSKLDFRPQPWFPTEESFKDHFREQVEPLHLRLSSTQLGGIPLAELVRAVFVYEHGNDVIEYYRHRAELSDGDRRSLDDYVFQKFLR